MLAGFEFYEWPLPELVFSIGTAPNANLWIDSQACYPNPVMQLLIIYYIIRNVCITFPGCLIRSCGPWGYLLLMLALH